MLEQQQKYDEARRLRREQGLAGNEIAQILNIGKKTAYKWIKDVELTPEQKQALANRKLQSAAWVTKKTELCEEARRLRREGASVKEIAKILNAAQSSVGGWVRGIELSEEQVKRLQQYAADQTQINQKKASQTNRTKHLNIRQKYQEEGRAKAREHDPLHIADCMLYWAEGTKSRNKLILVNSDPDMLRFYIRFLREGLQVSDEAIAIHINCYTDNGLSLEEIESYWLNVLNLPYTNLRKTMVNQQPASSKQRGRKLAYGVCTLSVFQTRLVQQVFGAIQEYTGIDKPEWLL